MKTKTILSAILLLGILSMPTVEAQLLKKIKDKINKTVGSKENEEETTNTNDEENTEPNQPTEEEKKANELKMGNFFGGGLEDIPDTYTFSYSLTYQLTSKKETMSLTYLLEPDATYFANKMDNSNNHQTMVYDFKKSAIVTFMDNGEQKMAMKMKMPNVKKLEKKFGTQIFPDEDEEIQITPIEGKEILGYTCLGYQVTSKEGVGKFWVTNDAPVSPNAVFGNFKSLPKSAKDQNLPLTENSLVMEMTYTSNKKEKDNMHMVCTSLGKAPLEIHKKDYKSGF